MAELTRNLRSKIMECHQLLQLGQEGKAKKIFKEVQKQVERLQVEEGAEAAFSDLYFNSGLVDLQDWFNGFGIKKSGR